MHMNLDLISGAIARARIKTGMTQEQLAERIGVTAQAVSKWENGKNLPDIENLLEIAEYTDTPYSVLLGIDTAEIPAETLMIRNRLFNEENMFTRIRTTAQLEHLPETYHALQYMRERHAGQFRKRAKYTTHLVAYINHPLMMACQALAFGIRDDHLLAAILLHDVVEDTGATLDELPVSEETKEIVRLVTLVVPEGKCKRDVKPDYYDNIQESGKACVVKIIDRCNNVSTMAATFNRKKMRDYIEETENYILPLCDILKDNYPEYSDIAFLVKYQILSVIETVKNLIVS